MTLTKLTLQKTLCNPAPLIRPTKYKDAKQIPSLFDVICVVSMITKVSSDLIKGDSRVEEITQPRFLTVHFMYEWCVSSNKSIAKYLGYENHSSVIHARQTVQDLLSIHDPYMKENADKIERVLKNLYKKYERPQKEVYVSPFSKN